MPCKGGAESLYSTFVLSTIREWGFPARHKETHMPHKGPHISIAPDFVVNRILRINLEDFADWPESVRHLATEIAEELFLVAYNPFVDSATVKASVKERFDREVFALAHHYANTIGEGITLFWSGHEAGSRLPQGTGRAPGRLPAARRHCHPSERAGGLRHGRHRLGAWNFRSWSWSPPTRNR